MTDEKRHRSMAKRKMPGVQYSPHALMDITLAVAMVIWVGYVQKLTRPLLFPKSIPDRAIKAS